MPIRRQLAPTVGPKASGVTFQAGTLGGIGETIAVGRVVRYGDNHYISCDESYIPADDYIVGCGVVPFGGVDVFIGYTSEAYGLPRIYSPSHPPYNQDGSEFASSEESADSDLHFVGMTGLGSDSQPNSQDPESILPALQDDVMSDAGSRSTVHVNVD